MKVLSLFDGMSCGMVALEKAGIKVEQYFASEIDKYAIKVSESNYSFIKQLGNVCDIDQPPPVDLLIGGSPCQTLSIVGNGSGFSGKSGLFYEYVRIYNQLKAENPEIKFLLENVCMKKEWADIISKELGVEPIKINSALVSGQNRERLYWTNIPNVKQPEDKGILLKDILEQDVDDKYYHSEAALNYMDRSVKGGRNHWDFYHHSDSNKQKSACITANFKKGVPYNVLIDRNLINQLNPFQGCSTKQPRMQHRIFDTSSKCPALTSFSGRLSIYPDKNDLIRKLTPIECERLQTLPDNYTNHVTDSHRYEMLGNGWTIDVIAHIFKNLK